MNTYASAQFIGYLAGDPEKIATQTDTHIVKASIYLKPHYKAKENSFFDLVAFGFQADFMETYLKKNDKVFVSCRPEMDQWQSKDGVRRSKIKFVVVEIIGLQPGTKKADPESDPKPESADKPETNSDDLPF